MVRQLKVFMCTAETAANNECLVSQLNRKFNVKISLISARDLGFRGMEDKLSHCISACLNNCLKCKFD